MAQDAAVRLRDDPPLILHIATLPKRASWRGIPVLVELPDDRPDRLVGADVQLLEESEYSYDIQGSPEPVVVEPTELFSPSNTSGLTGRLRARRATGTVTVQVRHRRTGTILGSGTIEVRSRKLNYVSDYRWMLQRIAEESAEAAQSYFAPSAQSFRPSTAGTTETLYQRFAFVQALLRSESFQGAVQLILHRPHHEYLEIAETIKPGRGTTPNSSTVRALTRPGPRTPVDLGHYPSLRSLPAMLQRVTHIETFDTIPNRFVRHALLSWRLLASDLMAACHRRKGAAAERGRREAAAFIDALDAILHTSLLKEVGPLEGLPLENTVLQRRPGYRDVLQAYLQAEAATMVDWEGSSDAFRAGLRDVATLYEYWAFLELARILASCRGVAIDRHSLFRRHDDGLTFELRRGKASVLQGECQRSGRTINVELWFNRQFERGESWTEPMRPDCSLLISAAGRNGTEKQKWLHFDAKYRVGTRGRVFRDLSVDDEHRPQTHPLSVDLLKMHAYRDAIDRTTGAYVLYPGTEEPSTRHRPTGFHEMLPGLGAFVLRPTSGGRGQDESADALRRFIDDALDHIAAVGTDEDRAAYWRDVVRDERRGRRLPFAAWIDKPPADITVLLGFVRSEAHLAWVERTRQYNLRGDEGRPGAVALTSAELAAEIVCLYDEGSDVVWFFESTGTFALQTAEQLVANEYPSTPGGSLYCCLQLGEQLTTPSGVTAEAIRALARADRSRSLWSAARVCRLIDLHEDKPSL